MRLEGSRRGVETAAIGVVLVASFLGSSSLGCHIPAIYNFGDSNSDTGSVSATFRRVPPPYGRTFFGKPSGRYSDGRLIIDFIGMQAALFPAVHLSSNLQDMKGCLICFGWKEVIGLDNAAVMR